MRLSKYPEFKVPPVYNAEIHPKSTDAPVDSSVRDPSSSSNDFPAGRINDYRGNSGNLRNGDASSVFWSADVYEDLSTGERMAQFPAQGRIFVIERIVNTKPFVDMLP